MRRIGVLATAAVATFGCRPVPDRAGIRQRVLASPQAWEEFLSFQGRDIFKLDNRKKARATTLLDTFLPERKAREGLYRLSPWCVWSLDAERGPSRIVVLEGLDVHKEGYWIPSAYELRVHVFGSDAKHLGSQWFLAGWRLVASDARVSEIEGYSFPCIEVACGPVIGGPDIWKQFYALGDDGVALIRLENRNGEAVRNRFSAPSHTIGPAPPTRTPEEWENLLDSEDHLFTLEALAWLGGIHIDLDGDKPDFKHESITEARLFKATRGRAGVVEALRRLVRSKNPWIREAAALALDTKWASPPLWWQ